LLSLLNTSSITPFFEIEVYPTLNDLIIERNRIQNFSDGLSEFTSITITEKEKESPTANVNLIDNTGTFDVVLNKYSCLFLITFGLKSSINYLINLFPNDSITGELKRVMIFSLINKQVNCSDGLVSYTFGLKGTSAGVNKDKNYFSGTVKDALFDTAKDLGIESQNIIIDFPEMNEKLSRKNFLSRVGKTNIFFINEVATKYNCLVIYNTNFDRNPLMLYIISFQNLEKYNLSKERGLKGNYHYLDYSLDESCNCISIDFDCNNGVGQTFGEGSQVIVDQTTGEVKVQELNPENDNVTVYVLNKEKIRKEVAGKPIGEASRRVAQIISSNFETDWEKLKNEYFIKTRTSTVSNVNGAGYTAKCKVVPNPLYQIGDKIFLGASENSLIPPTFRSKISFGKETCIWRIVGIEQTISSDNYEMTLEIMR